MISASHNPFEDNGFKFFSSEGTKLPDRWELEVEALLEGPISTVESSRLGKAWRVDDAPGRYIEFCKSTVPAGFSLKGMKLVVDCANGAAYATAPHVFAELGAEVVTIGDQPDGLNINRQVGSTHIQVLTGMVKHYEADLGIALDGNGDRCLMVDSDGALIDGDQMLYIIARSRQQQEELIGPVVGTLMTNLEVEHALAAHQITLLRSAVGDRYVLEMLQENGGMIGGGVLRPSALSRPYADRGRDCQCAPGAVRDR